MFGRRTMRQVSRCNIRLQQWILNFGRKKEDHICIRQSPNTTRYAPTARRWQSRRRQKCKLKIVTFISVSLFGRRTCLQRYPEQPCSHSWQSAPIALVYKRATVKESCLILSPRAKFPASLTAHVEPRLKDLRHFPRYPVPLWPSLATSTQTATTPPCAHLCIGECSPLSLSHGQVEQGVRRV